jgi:hypothetical protein
MTSPFPENPGDNMRLLLDIWTKQVEIGAQLGVISEQLKAIPDHEQRIRALEHWRYSLPLAALGALVSAGFTLASYLHH